MNIFTEIKGIQYEIKMPYQLKEIHFEKFDINESPTYCLIKNDKLNFAISKWVSPKRTRSYPFERIYNTLSATKKITVIPIIKDEGAKGDRDFIQWDTISLMSLLDVYVIFAYYNEAEKHPTRANKITNQKFENQYITKKINEISNYHSSALHWNLKEAKEQLPLLINIVKDNYQKIGNEKNVLFHKEKGIEKFYKQFQNGVDNFMKTSRKKAKEAQNREHLTIQPKEVLTTLTKAKITIKNYLGGLYYLTTDEIQIDNDNLYLIEAKHSKNSKLPNISDIKDGLLKMILYTNLENTKINDKNFKAIPVLKLTSNKLTGMYQNNDEESQKELFLKNNDLNDKQIKIIKSLDLESQINHFNIIIQGND